MRNIAVMPRDVIVHLRRSRYLPQDGGGTVFCVMTHTGTTFGALAYLPPGAYPEFDGEEAWFRLQWHSRTKFRFIEQVADRSGRSISID